MQGAEKKVAKSCGKKPVKIGEAQKCVEGQKSFDHQFWPVISVPCVTQKDKRSTQTPCLVYSHANERTFDAAPCAQLYVLPV